MSLVDRIRTYPRTRRGDARGWLLKVIDGHEAGLPPATGEFYVVQALPGQTRGGHFHPQANEWFTVIAGTATLLLADPQTGERAELALRAEEPVTIHVPAGVAHAFRASGEPMLLVAYSDLLYDPCDTVPFAFD